jgi:saccharopine dehydrogenase-like NADP-dependent oxidoreductase
MKQAGKPDPVKPARILIVGGYGAFGARAAERLAREPGFEIIVAGRSLARAQAAARELQRTSPAAISAFAVDATAVDTATLAALAPSIVINASGPFQRQDYSLARAAIENGAHYIDLADASDFVTGFAADKALDAAALTKGVLAVSGASTVPAISGAVLDRLAPDFARVGSIHHGVSPGNSFDPGPATTASILSAIGKPFLMKRDGTWHTAHGWQGLSRHHFPEFGNRWMGYCNVPDLTLFADRYPSLQTIDFKAGVEVTLFHVGMWLLSWPSRWGLIASPERLTAPLLAVKRALRFLGSDAGGMFVVVGGVDHGGAAKSIAWHLIARRGHGPYIPTTPAVILARKLARGETIERGARACLGLITLAEIERELSDLDISMCTA